MKTTYETTLEETISWDQNKGLFLDKHSNGLFIITRFEKVIKRFHEEEKAVAYFDKLINPED